MPGSKQDIVAAIMRGSDKPRFKWGFVNDELKYVKCIQGHSGNRAVIEPDDKYRVRLGDIRYLYHGTSDYAVPLIQREGVLPNIRGRPQSYWSPLPMDQNVEYQREESPLASI